MNPEGIIDRLLALAPLAVLIYVLRRHEAERVEHRAAAAREQEAFRTERRELLNRLQFPSRMPVATRPVDQAPQSVRERIAQQQPARPPRIGGLWGGVGTAAPATPANFIGSLPGDGDQVPGDEE